MEKPHLTTRANVSSSSSTQTPPPSQEWRLIETAPTKNVTEGPEYVLLAGPSIGICTGRAARYTDGYVFAGVSHVSGNLAETGGITHWMPLPAPPSVEAGEPPQETNEKL